MLDLDATLNPIRLRTSLWKNKHNVLLDAHGMSVVGANTKTFFMRYCWMAGTSFLIDTNTGECEIGFFGQPSAPFEHTSPPSFVDPETELAFLNAQLATK